MSSAAASWISTVYLIDHGAPEGVPAAEGLQTQDFDVLYDKPWNRLSPYLIGKQFHSTMCSVTVFDGKTYLIHFISCYRFGNRRTIDQIRQDCPP